MANFLVTTLLDSGDDATITGTLSTDNTDGGGLSLREAVSRRKKKPEGPVWAQFTDKGYHMKLVPIFAAALSGAISSAAVAADYTVERTLHVSASGTLVWNLVGDFCDIDDWHPRISSCALKVSDGRLHRVMTPVDGAIFEEQRIAAEHGLSYTYKLAESPLPVENYIATFSVEQVDGVVITWSARFSSEDPSVETEVIGMIEAGLEGINQQIGAE